MQSTFPNSFFNYTAFEAQKILQTYTAVKVEWLEIIHSTNDYLKDKIRQNNVNLFTDENNQFVTLAWEQTNGRGQYKRAWKSQAKQCLIMSYAMKLPIKNNDNNIPSGLSLVSGISVCQAFENISNTFQNLIFLKWPNDIIMQDKKLGGILAEVISQGSTHYVIIGLGINLCLNQTGENSQNIINAIGLDDFIPKIPEQNIYRFIADILYYLEINIQKCCEFGFEYFLPRWNKCAYKPKTTQLFSINAHDKIEAYYDHVDSQGNLYVKNKYGNIFKL